METLISRSSAPEAASSTASSGPVEGSESQPTAGEQPTQSTNDAAQDAQSQDQTGKGEEQPTTQPQSDAKDDKAEDGDGEGAQESKADGESKGEASPDQSTKQEPFHTHPRFRELTRQNKQLSEQVAQLSKSLEQIQKPNTQQSASGPDYTEKLEALQKKFNDGDINAQKYSAELSKINQEMFTVNSKAMQEQFEKELQESAAKAENERIIRQFQDDNPDFLEAVESGELDEIKSKSRLHDEFSAYYEWKAHKLETELKTAKDAEYKRGLKEGEERARKNQKAKQKSRSIPDGPAAQPTRTEGKDVRLKDPAKYGGKINVLAARHAERKKRSQTGV